jgi:hypothetical protein
VNPAGEALAPLAVGEGDCVGEPVEVLQPSGPQVLDGPVGGPVGEDELGGGADVVGADEPAVRDGAGFDVVGW